MNRLEDALIGQRLSFVYDGGSTPGVTRVVDVIEVQFDRILGIDIGRSVDNAMAETRQYLFSLARNVEVLAAPVPVVEPVDNSFGTRVVRETMSFINARQELQDRIDTMTGEELADALQLSSNVDRVTFENGELSLERDVTVPHCVLNGDSGLNWVNTNGDAMVFVCVGGEGHITLEINDEEVSAEDCVRKLSQHMGLTQE